MYWIAVYDILEEAGLEVYLVNARDTKNLPGRKTDVQESQWLMKLTLTAYCEIRFVRRRRFALCGHTGDSARIWCGVFGRHIQRMQKALTQMNIQLANVISDITGVTLQAILKAILDGERDPRELAAYRDCRVEASKEEIAQALEGNWQEDQLFVLRRCQKQITDCDQQLAQYLAQLEDRSQGATLPEETRKGRRKNKQGHPQFNLREELFRMTGTDLTQIDGIDVMAVMTVVSEVGWDMSKWKTENHFVSWLKLSPDNKISGGKVIGKGRMPTNNRATTVLRMAATTLRESEERQLI